MEQVQSHNVSYPSSGVLAIRISARRGGRTRDETKELQQERYGQCVDHDRHKRLPVRGVIYDWQRSTAYHSAEGSGEGIPYRNYRAHEANVLGRESSEDEVQGEYPIHHCQAKPEQFHDGEGTGGCLRWLGGSGRLG
jgi:hypothetical protein